MINKICVIGAGYVGLSNACLLSQSYEVILVDTNKNKLKSINSKLSPVEDKKIDEFLKTKDLSLSTSENIIKADLYILALPTNFDDDKDSFDTSIIEEVANNIVIKDPNAVILIKSTVPIGFTEMLQKKHRKAKIIFSPEFLREGMALEDNLHPSRIVIGEDSHVGKHIGELFSKLALNSPPVMFMSSTEAESVKLFANTFLALRVAFFNELDSFALTKMINPGNIIKGICSDHRIGNHYNNPSFGYGGYCLPKDTKQLLANFNNIPQSIFSSIVSSNNLRKEYLAEKVLQYKPKCIGIYRLIMKANSDNLREASVFGLIDKFISFKVPVIVYEPLLSSSDRENFEIENDFEEFCSKSDLIVANRIDSRLLNIDKQIFSRDLTGDC